MEQQGGGAGDLRRVRRVARSRAAAPDPGGSAGGDRPRPGGAVAVHRLSGLHRLQPRPAPGAERFSHAGSARRVGRGPARDANGRGEGARARPCLIIPAAKETVEMSTLNLVDTTTLTGRSKGNDR